MWSNNQSLRGLIKDDMEAVGHEERISRLYYAMQKGLAEYESLGVSPAEIDLAAVLVYFDRKRRHADPSFRMPATHELQAMVAELDQDAKTEPLVTWLAQNLNRFSRFVTDADWTPDTLRELMETKFYGMSDTNPVVLRAVIRFALAEYVARGYDPEPLQHLFETFLPSSAEP
ncbi:MAG: hypothetical protein R3B95_19205 [Nitrospirales bacterium]|nr:hypothetical protein [Nitrospirales bacterium]